MMMTMMATTTMMMIVVKPFDKFAIKNISFPKQKFKQFTSIFISMVSKIFDPPK